ncbi:hypothetical protein E2C01_096851 [Portunus trituberculatus]|uniref:Uncharacterized protein n=1 Tax=Portunus trituberculatus TaxID=210409 RepID=A0A5B7JWQ2_PORTR|nr:hypothetical protein [Portunus trituberculatus]
MKEMISNILEKQDKLAKENAELKERIGECEKVREVNQVVKEEMEELKGRTFVGPGTIILDAPAVL